MTLVELTHDDWDLTRQQIRGQIVTLKLQLATLEAALELCERMVEELP